MKDKIILFVLFLFFVIITFVFSYFIFSPFIGDEIWSYGFSYNISKGMIPYRDFNMVVTPLYSFIGSVFIIIFGEYLFSVHVLNSIFIVLILIMLYRCIGIKSLFLYPLFLVFNLPTYNYCCLFFLFLIIYLIENKKDNDLLLGFVVGLIFLTKQSIGILMIIPLLFYSKKKIKSICSFLVPLLILVVYLIWNNALYEFVDYCFLGMFDFGESNTVISIFTLFVIIQVLYLIIILWKSRFRDKVVFYILMFQIMSYPIFDIFHWFMAFIPSFYYVFNKTSLKNIRYKKEIGKFLFCLLIITLCVGYIFTYFIDNKDIYKEDNNYFYLRNVYGIGIGLLEEKGKIVEKYINSNNEVFFVMANAYMLKLYMNLEINKFDLLNNGNMGYNGDERYIKEIEEMCKDKTCVFYVEDIDFDNKYCQFSREIYDYVIENYSLIDSYDYFDVYSN